MRDLTPQEINDAPDWATSVFENTQGNLYWFNEVTGAALSVGENKRLVPICLNKTHYAYSAAQPIPRKEFDISDYDFSEGGISVVSISDDCLTLCVGHSEGDFTKEDVAAMANMLNMTAEDLK